MTGTVQLVGLTWDHPRAYEGLAEATRQYHAQQDAIFVTWERHSLRGFESAAIEESAARYDLVVLDHPFMGDAVRSRCLLRLDDVESVRRAIDEDPFVGPSLSSYRFADGLWALPIDSACQTAAYRRDRFDSDGLPRDLAAVMDAGPLTLAMACPHAFMNFLTVCGLLGADISGQSDELVPRAVALEALDILRTLAARLPEQAFSWSSIGALDAMAAGDAPPYCPFVFCFNSYARPDHGAQLAFAAPPELVPRRGVAGTVAGGTGLAVSASSPHPAAAIEAAVHFASDAVQRTMAMAGGQPAARRTWLDTAADAANGGMFSACLQTMELCSLRPRFAGYMTLQNAAGDLLRDDAMARSTPAEQVIDRLDALYRTALAGGGRCT